MPAPFVGEETAEQSQLVGQGGGKAVLPASKRLSQGTPSSLPLVAPGPGMGPGQQQEGLLSPVPTHLPIPVTKHNSNG